MIRFHFEVRLQEIFHLEEKRRGGSRRCGECGEPTRNEKPYCTKHYYLNPHAAKVLRDLEEGVDRLEDAEAREWELETGLRRR